MKSLCSYYTKAAVGVTKHQYAIWLEGCKELVGAVDDVAAGGSKVITHSVHINFGVFQLQVLEEHAVEVVVVVLTGMGQNDVEVFAALVDDCGKTDYLRAGADYDAKFEFAVFLPRNITIIEFRLLIHMCNICIEGKERKERKEGKEGKEGKESFLYFSSFSLLELTTFRLK